MNKLKYIFTGTALVFILFYIAGVISPPSFSEQRVIEALTFCKKNNLSTEYAVFVDFSKHSRITGTVLMIHFSDNRTRNKTLL